MELPASPNRRLSLPLSPAPALHSEDIVWPGFTHAGALPELPKTTSQSELHTLAKSFGFYQTHVTEKDLSL